MDVDLEQIWQIKIPRKLAMSVCFVIGFKIFQEAHTALSLRLIDGLTVATNNIDIILLKNQIRPNCVF